MCKNDFFLFHINYFVLWHCVEPSLLEATHESLIPLEEEEEEEGDRVNLVDQVISLARDLSRSHRLGANQGMVNNNND